MTGDRHFAGIELGGTKIVCGIATGAGDVLERTSIPTRAGRDPRRHKNLARAQVG